MDSLQRFSRKCAASGRDLVPGDRYVSVLLDTVKGIQRQDYAAENWGTEPEDTICWWFAEIPLPSQVKMRWAPDRVLLAYFQTLYEKQQWETLNVLAMAMVRRRLMTLSYENPEATAEDIRLRTMVLASRDGQDIYQVPEVDLSRVDLSAIETELQDHLFTDQPDFEDDEETDNSVSKGATQRTETDGDIQRES